MSNLETQNNNRAMTLEEFEALEEESLQWLEQQQHVVQHEFKLGQYERFDVNLERGELTYSSAGVVKVIAHVQVVGSLSTTSNSWMWSWANSSIPEKVKQEIVRVKDWGEQRQVYPLINAAMSDVDDTYYFSLAAIAARLLNAKSVYRAPGRNYYVYLILTNIRWA